MAQIAALNIEYSNQASALHVDYMRQVADLSAENLRQTAVLDAKTLEMKKELESIETGRVKQSMVDASLSSIVKLCGKRRGR